MITLVRDYENRFHRLDPPTPIQALTGLMDRLEVTRRDLLPIFGTQARISEFLNGKRPLSKNQITALHTSYAIPYDSLMG